VNRIKSFRKAAKIGWSVFLAVYQFCRGSNPPPGVKLEKLTVTNVLDFNEDD
jgi:hypothetical protein